MAYANLATPKNSVMRCAFTTASILLVAAISIAWAQAPLATGRTAATPAEGDRVREGTTLVDVSGRFLRSAGRFTFQTVDDRRYIALENLALERVAQQLQEDAGSLEWTVSGVVTEYRAGNFLLVTRAVLRPHSDPRPTEGRREF